MPRRGHNRAARSSGAGSSSREPIRTAPIRASGSALDVRVRAALPAALVHPGGDGALARVPVRDDPHLEALARQLRDRYPLDAMSANGAPQLAVHERVHAHDPAAARLVDPEREAAVVLALDRPRLATAGAASASGRPASVADRQDELRRVLRVVPDPERAAEAVPELRQRWREVRPVPRLERQ